MTNHRNPRGPLSADSLERLKYEVADELGLRTKIDSTGWAGMTSRECGDVGGPIGGSMVKLMIRYAKDQLGAGQRSE